MKKAVWLAVPLTVVSFALNFYFYRQVRRYQETVGKYQVKKVLDGDSFRIDFNQTVRLADIDAPELGLCLGEEAKQSLEELILWRYVKITPVGTDRFGRVVGRVFLDNRLINEIMTKNGRAKYDSTGPAGDDREKIRVGAQMAKENGRGVWSLRCYQTENKEKPECQIKGNISKSDSRKIYHFPGCSEYDRTVVELDLGERWFCTEEEARQAGYEKSENCYGKTYPAL